MQDDHEGGQPRLVLVPLTSIRISTSNPRTDGERELDGLALALEAGLVQPPTLVEIRPGEYEVELGERRVRAAQARGWAEVPAIIAVPRPPIVAHQRRLVENLHRRDLRPLDEARALKLGWLCANATEMGLTSATNAALEEAGSVRAGLTRVATVLEEAGWTSTRPPVTQDAYLRSLGLGLSTAALRKKLQLLALSEEAQARLEALGLTEAALRAFVRLDEAEQAVLLGALEADPGLARQVRTIVDGVRKKGRQVADAVAIARGQVPGAPIIAPAPGAARPASEDGEDDDTFERGAGGEVSGEIQAADQVLPLLELAQQLAAVLTALSPAALAALPAPWDGFGQQAIATIREALRPFDEG
jgi:ParB-like chromosome segregation protein Spo0J